MKILLVDDDGDQLEVRSLLLHHYGFESVCAAEPLSALQLAREQQPAIAVIDLRLPRERDGLALLSELKQQFPGMGVIVLTGSDPGRLSRLPEMESVSRLIAKGAGPRTLLSALTELADRVAH